MVLVFLIKLLNKILLAIWKLSSSEAIILILFFSAFLIYNDVFLGFVSGAGGISGEYASPSKTSTSTVLVKTSV